MKKDEELKKERDEYCNFMFNEKNIMNCNECPENSDFDSWENKLPCEQQNCWVYCHTKEL
jgi:hypothetical protein